MISVDLSRPFARRLIPLVLVSSGLFAAAVPLAFHLEGRRELASGARVAASQVASVVEQAMSVRPLLWRYDAATLALTLRSGQNPWPLPGLTGRLSLTSEGRIERSLDWARVRNGTPELFDPLR